MANFKLKINQSGVREAILKNNNKLKSLERDVMMRALSEVKAAFIQDFGTPGEFTLKYDPWPTRSGYQILANDAKTTAILKRHPRWLDRFSKGAKL